MLERATDREAYLRRPAGQFYEGRTWARFSPIEGFVGGIFWGCVSDSDLREYLDLVLEEVQRHGSNRLTYLDLSCIQSFDRESFVTLYDFYARHESDLGRSFTRIAGVHPQGLTGAFLGGLPLVQPIPYPAQFFANTTSALEFLGVVDAATVTVLEELRERLAKRDVLLHGLQALLENAPGELTVATVARTLGLSERSLQRRLLQLGTSFGAESGAARVRVAKRLLSESDMTLTAIALEVGCNSAQHFSVMFRKATGETPGAWRHRMRPTV